VRLARAAGFLAVRGNHDDAALGAAAAAAAKRALAPDGDGAGRWAWVSGLSDEDVASVLTFIRREWEHNASPVDAKFVAVCFEFCDPGDGLGPFRVRQACQLFPFCC
jgi:hypothetical protein